MRRMMVVLIFCCFMAVYSAAQIHRVPTDYATIQQAMDASATGDTVLVMPGVYFENLVFHNSITLGSLYVTTNDTSYISQTVIDGSGSGIAVLLHMIFGDIDSTCRMTGFTIRNANTGIQCSWTEPQLDHLYITDNHTSTRGGGISLLNGSPTIRNSRITGNSAVIRGGGIYGSDGSSPVLENVLIRDNTSFEGGGIFFFYNSYPVLSGVTITGNHAGNNGGGIACFWTSFGFDSLNRCSIYNNDALEGADISLEPEAEVLYEIYLDTFSVASPTDFFAHPLWNYDFDIQHSVKELVDSDIYVSESGDDNNDGLTQDAPFKTIHKAFSSVQADPDHYHTVYLLEGIFSFSATGERFPIYLPDYISLVSLAGTATLDAENEATVIYLNANDSCKLSGLTITGGSAVRGGGIRSYLTKGSLENLIITGNSAVTSGGGIYCRASELQLFSSVISGNSAGEGGGITSDYSDIVLDSCRINGNEAGNYGGGMSINGNMQEIINTGIEGNVAQGGGGIACRGQCEPVFRNVIIAGNNATVMGGGLFCEEAGISFANSTVAGNNTAGDGGGAFLVWGSTISFINSILWQNSPEQAYFGEEDDGIQAEDKLYFTFCDVEDGAQGIITPGTNKVFWLEGSITAAPLFTGSGDHPYALTGDSPCIDAGNPDTTGLELPLWDYVGNWRVWDGDWNGIARIDMGAYEYGSLPVDVGDIYDGLRLTAGSYPNPFTRNVTIEYLLDEPSAITLEIYDFSGKKVADYHFVSKTSGLHSYHWDAAGLSSGIYFCRLDTHKQNSTFKMIKID